MLALRASCGKKIKKIGTGGIRTLVLGMAAHNAASQAATVLNAYI